MARPTVTSAYLRHEAEQYLIGDAKLWGVLRAAANTIDELEERATRLLTVEERALTFDLGQIWNRLCKVVAVGPSRQGDLAEAVHHIHALQNVVMAQAAARAYPDEFRLLGSTVGAAVATEHQENDR